MALALLGLTLPALFALPSAPVLAQTPGVTFAPTSLALTEGHATDARRTYTAVLDSDPGAGVTVTVAAASSNNRVAYVSPNSLSFTGGSGGSWSTPKTFTAIAELDSGESDDNETVTHAVTADDASNAYHDLAGVGSVSVAVTDAGRGFVVVPTELLVRAGGTATYAVRLKSWTVSSGRTVTVTPSSDDSSHATVSGALVFNGNDWMLPQTVTVTGAGSAGDAATVTHAVAAPRYEDYRSLVPSSVSVTVAGPGDMPGCASVNDDGAYPMPEGWALKPPGLALGARFRLLFITDATFDAAASDIATYNGYVQAAAKGGHAAISASCGDRFKVLGSTATVDARENTDTESTDTAAAIHWLGGAKVADDYADFYDGTWDDYGATDENGIANRTIVFTGSNNDGTKHVTRFLGAPLPMGSRGDHGSVQRGHPSQGQMLQAGDSSTRVSNEELYALSPVFEVSAAPPPVECTTQNTDGSYTVPEGWALRPAAVGAGRPFRLLFMSSGTRNAQPTDIATYNAWIRAQAKAGHAGISDSCGDLFAAVGSTSSVDARVNTDTESTDTDAPIFWLNGAKLADGHADFYDGSWDSVARKDENGADRALAVVFTGSDADGTADDAFPLGGGNSASAVGNPNGTAGPIADGSSSLSHSNSRPFYGLSPLFRVAGTPPHVVSVSMATAAADEGTGGSPAQTDRHIAFSVAPAWPDANGHLYVDVCLTGTAAHGTDYRLVGGMADGSGATTDGTGGDLGFSEADGELCASNLSAWTVAGPSAAGHYLRVLHDADVEPDETVVLTARRGTGTRATPDNADVSTRMGAVTFTIRNDDSANAAPTVANAIPDQSATPGTAFSFAFAANAFADADNDGLTYAAAQADGTALPSWLTFTAGTRAFSGTPAAADSGTVTVRVTASDGNGGSVSDDFTITVAAVPAITITGGSAVTEGTAASFTVNASPAPSSNLTVGLTVADAPNADFVAGADEGGGSVVINANATSATHDVPTTGGGAETADEPSGPVTLTVAAGTGYTGAGASGTVTVNDDDATTATLAGAAGNVAEGGAKAFTVTLGRGLRSGEALDVPLTFTGTATRNADYTTACPGTPPTGVACHDLNDTGGSANPRVTFTGPSTGATATAVTLTLTAVADATPESTPETVVIGLGTLNASSGTNLGGGASGTDELADFSIADAPAHGFTVDPTSLEVNASGTATYSVKLASWPGGAGTVTVTPSSDDASKATVSGAVSFDSSTWSIEQDVTVTAKGAVGDTATISHAVTAPAGSPYASLVPADVAVTLVAGPGYVLDPASLTVEEGGSADFTLALATQPSSTVLVELASDNADVTAAPDSGIIFTTSSSGNLSWSTARTVTVSAAEDGTADHESATVTVSANTSDTGYTSLTATLPVSVVDDEGGTQPSASFAAAASSAAEASGTNNVRVNLSPAPTTPITLSYRVGGSATPTDDFAITGSNSLAVAASATSADIPVMVAQDVLHEGGETVVLTLSSGAGYTLGTTKAHVLTITDDDAAPTAVALSASPATVSEGDGDTDVEVTAAVGGTTRWGAAQTVRVSVDGSGGADVVGFAAVADFDLAIPAGAASGTAEFELAPVDDSTETGDETVTVSGTLADVTVSAATVSLTDDDAATVPAATFPAASQTIPEGQTRNVAVTLSERPSTPVTVNFGVGGTATAGTDYQALGTSVTVGANTRVANVPVTTLQDSDFVNETIVLTLAAGSGYTVGAQGAHTITIDDDETAPGLDLSPTALTVDEGGSAEFTVALATQPSLTVLVELESDNADVTVDPALLTFTAGAGDLAWNVARTVTVSAAEDGGGADDSATVTLATQTSADHYNVLPDVEVAVTVRDNDGGGGGGSGGGGSGGGGGGGGGGSGGSSAALRILHAEPVVEGLPARFLIELDEPARQRLDLLASTAPGTASEGADYERLNRHPVAVPPGESELRLEVATLRDAETEDDETFTVTLSVAPGSAPARVVRPEARGTILDGPPPSAAVPLLPAGGREQRHGFVRVLDLGGAGGPVSIAAVDDGGVEGTASTLRLAPGGGAHFNSDDLEAGNPAKGLEPGAGAPTRGGWRLRLAGADAGALAYARTADGFVTPLAGAAPADADGRLFVAFLNPGSNWRQVSLLRLINDGEGDAEVTVTGADDAGGPGAAPVSLTLPGGTARVLSAQELERGAPGLTGALGDGRGKWRLSVAADRPVQAMSLLESPTGHLANLSAGTAPRTESGDGTARTLIPLFPAAGRPDGRQGFLRIVNRGGEAVEATIEATDDAGTAHPALTLSLGPREAVQLNSDDLEAGAPAKGLPLGTGAGGGDWRLAVTAPEAVAALAYVRHLHDGFVTGMNALAPRVDGAIRVDFLNPASNYRQRSLLRLINPNAEPAEVTVTGTDDAGQPGAAPVSLTLPAGAARTIASADLESGADGLAGALGDGKGKWRLRIASDAPVHAMGLLLSPTGHLANLSPGVLADPPEE